MSEISREVCPCCDEMVDMFIEPDEDYEFVDGRPLLFRRCPACSNESIDPKRNPDNVALREKKKHEAK